MLNILVVDDEAPIRDWIVYTIERAGSPYNVVGLAKSGKEALTMVEKFKPNLIITDIKMPGMDGIELMKIVKKIQPYTKFVVLTNYAEFSYAKEAISYGAKEYILKSELRGSDLLKILDEVYKEQLELTTGKENEIFSSGFIDLYSLYQNKDDKDFVKTYMSTIEMNNDKPFSILGLYHDLSLNQRKIIQELAYENEFDYFNVALKNQIVFVIIQDNIKDLGKKTEVFAKKYFKKFRIDIAVGKVEENIYNILDAIDKVEITLFSSFFNQDKQIIYYNRFEKSTELNRRLIREEYSNILSLISLRDFHNAKEKINNWFNYFLHINADDVIWGKEMCIKFMISVEERLYQLHSDYEGINIRNKAVESTLECKTICIDMIDYMLSSKDDLKTKSIQEALDYIHNNYSKDISLVKVAGYIYRSPEYFSRLFKDEVGVNFSVYLMMYRLNKAAELLKDPDLLISQISYLVGYSNPSYFSRAYKKYMGLTPEETRSQNNTITSK